MDYNAANWYWLASDSRIYSSSQQALIKEKDKDFVAWKAAGNLPTPWPKDGEGKETNEALAAVLAPYSLRLFPPTLDEVKQDLQLKVDEQAEQERQKYITGGSGQSMTYTEKFNQAVDYSKKWQAHMKTPTQEPEPNENDYLLLKAGLGIDGSTLIEVAATVTHAYAVWQQIGAAIEGLRLKTKMAIEEAKTAEDAQTIFAAIEWPNTKKQENTAPTT